MREIHIAETKMEILLKIGSSCLHKFSSHIQIFCWKKWGQRFIHVYLASGFFIISSSLKGNEHFISPLQSPIPVHHNQNPLSSAFEFPLLHVKIIACRAPAMLKQ